MIKKIKKWGDGLGVYFNKDDIEYFQLKEGDWIDLSDVVIEKRDELNKD